MTTPAKMTLSPLSSCLQEKMDQLCQAAVRVMILCISNTNANRPAFQEALMHPSRPPGTRHHQRSDFQGHRILCVMENARIGAQENHGTALIAFVCKECCQGCKWLRIFVKSRKSTSEAKEFGNVRKKNRWWQMREWHRQRGGKFSKIQHMNAGN